MAYRAVSLALAAVMSGCERSAPPPAAEPVQRGAEEQQGVEAMSLTMQSSAFGNSASIPKRYTGDGDDVSPPLNWTGVPAAAREVALICDDPDAPRPQPWVHWVIYKIPAAASGLPEGVAKAEKPGEPAGSLQGKNSWGRIGYGGPAPPRGHGVHHYHFKLYALDRALDVAPGLDKDGLLAEMQGHILAEAELIGTYQR